MGADWTNREGSFSSSTVDDPTAISSSQNDAKISDKQSIDDDDETKKIQSLKCLVFFVLAFATAGALAVYFYLKNSENVAFELQFEDDATKVLASLGTSLDLTLGAIDALAMNIISYAKASGQTWPYVTIPDFTVRAGKVLSLSNAYIINIYTYVEANQRSKWEKYSFENSGWVDEAIEIHANDSSFTGPIVREYPEWPIHWYDEFDKENPGLTGTESPGPYVVWWQCVPVIALDPVYNWDLMSWYNSGLESVLTTHRVTISEAYLIAYPNETEKLKENEAEAEWIKNFIPPDENPIEPVSDLFYPLIDEATEVMNLFDGGDYNPANHTFDGMLSMSFYWREMIKNILPPGSDGIVVVFENECNPTFTYQINGPTVEYLGTGDFHDSQFDHMEKASALLDLRRFAIKESGYSGNPVADDVCPFYIRIFPSETMRSKFTSSNPIFLSVSAGVTFLLFAVSFLLYDNWVQRQRRLIEKKADQTAAVVSSLFPESVARRLMEENSGASFVSASRRLKTFLNDGKDAAVHETKPIADLFPYTTVLFADISGFTSWSSTRDPSQVFVLLETIYKAFDKLALRRHVFKIETIGDCYVCVTGLPNPHDRHAVLMAKFANDGMRKFHELVKKLEVSLGPDTADLGIRFGMHSGPVTAGVLRGDRPRFQLFGDTVNTAARMESSGLTNKIQVSNTTAKLLIEAGKEHWLTRRDDAVIAKGKGVLDSFWLDTESKSPGSVVSDMSADLSISDLEEHLGKHDRLIDWMVDLLLSQIVKIVARHEGLGIQQEPSSALVYHTPVGKTSFDEVVEVMKLPKFDAEAAQAAKNESEVNIDPVVVGQLRQVVSSIAAAYRDNCFHNFEHACHVTMAVYKFLTRIVAPDIDEAVEVTSKAKIASRLHEYTHGINSHSDPLTILAIIFSALIHDVDHQGVSNQQLCKEDERMALLYKNKSVAEQNSLDLAWELLMEDQFEKLRSTIFATRTNLMRFRQVVVNVVLATDIFDKELNGLRKSRWERAFSEEVTGEEKNDLRATIVLEHIIQASDVSHTMQHWHVYRKWNERLFMEMYDAFQDGRMGSNPAEFWYNGEIGFFDNYIIPLAKKLRDCKVFGVSSDEVLNYAQNNRAEWESRGQAVVAEMVDKLRHPTSRDKEDEEKKE